ncbi:hypothetical protein [Methylomonas sp. MgM2]
MKYKHLAFVFAFAGLSLPTIGNIAYAEEAAATASSSEEDKGMEMFRFSLRMDKLEFVKKAMHLSEEQEKKFLDEYFPYDTELKMLNDERLSIIQEYADKFEQITDNEADKLVKRSFDFRKKRLALLEKYYEKIAKATSKVIAARFLQVESVLQGAGDVTIGASIPLMEK